MYSLIIIFIYRMMERSWKLRDPQSQPRRRKPSEPAKLEEVAKELWLLSQRQNILQSWLFCILRILLDLAAFPFESSKGSSCIQRQPLFCILRIVTAVLWGFWKNYIVILCNTVKLTTIENIAHIGWTS